MMIRLFIVELLLEPLQILRRRVKSQLRHSLKRRGGRTDRSRMTDRRYFSTHARAAPSRSAEQFDLMRQQRSVISVEKQQKQALSSHSNNSCTETVWNVFIAYIAVFQYGVAWVWVSNVQDRLNIKGNERSLREKYVTHCIQAGGCAALPSFEYQPWGDKWDKWDRPSLPLGPTSIPRH